MSSHDKYNENLYKRYIGALGRFSRCIEPVANAIFERQDNVYDVYSTLDIEKYCQYERKEVQALRQQLIDRDNAQF